MKNRANEIVSGGMLVDIRSRILTIRGVQVMLDRDLAELYDVPTGALNQAVKRNAKRFPERFVFQLSEKEFANWKSQIVISNSERMGLRKRPYAFTEHGITMLAALLKSERAIEISVRIVDAFVAMRRYLVANGQILQQIDQLRRQQILDQSRNEERFDTVFTALADGRLLPSGIIPANTEFDSIRQVSRLVESAKSEIVVIDPYADATILDVLSGKKTGVTVRLVCKNRGKPTSTEIAKFNRQYKGLTVSYSDDFHDRFVLIDNAELHNFGSSVNSLGRRVSTYSTHDAKEIKKLLAQLP